MHRDIVFRSVRRLAWRWVLSTKISTKRSDCRRANATRFVEARDVVGQLQKLSVNSCSTVVHIPTTAGYSLCDQALRGTRFKARPGAFFDQIRIGFISPLST
jgi:hypothetical protein